MHRSKRVLVTGNHGYIGSVMAPWLHSQGYDVTGLDCGYFHDCTLFPAPDDIPTMHKDLRDVTASDLAGFDAIVHLAALSNDPIGNLNSRWTRDINLEATVSLALHAKAAGVRRFVFSSSCIMYGVSELDVVDERSPLAPQTEYARSKVEAEAALGRLADDRFSPIFCRNGTIYGLSPRMRFDTVLNNLMGSAFTSGRVVIHSDGTPWRPVVHVRDVVRAFGAVLEAPLDRVHNQAFNLGTDTLNHQVRELADIAAETVPGCTVVMQSDPGADQRTYKAGFAKFQRTFPDFTFEWSARKGADELYAAFCRINLTSGDFVDRRFTRLHWLQHLLTTRAIDEDLRWIRPIALGDAA